VLSDGRTARLLADLMVLQANRTVLSLNSVIDNDMGFSRYIQAIHAGFGQDIAPLATIFLEALKKE